MRNSTANSPTTNTPIKCPICSVYIFKYLLQLHYDAEHPDDSVPEQYLQGDDELKLIKKKLKVLNTANDKTGNKYNRDHIQTPIKSK